MNPESNKLDQALKLVIEGKNYETFDEYKLATVWSFKMKENQ